MDKIDSLQIGKSLELFPEQIKESFKKAVESNIAEFRPKAVVISGMGGSSNAAKILESIYENDFKVPIDIDIQNDYGLPSHVDRDTLVIANSYSGNTEETLTSIDAAKKVGASVLAVTTGGKLKEMIDAGEVSGAIVDGKSLNPSGYPKSGLGISFGALAGVLSKTGIIGITINELVIATDELTEIRKTWDVENKAVWLTGSIPVFLSGKPFVGALNAGRNATCEIGRVFSLFFDFPEVNHVMIEATQKPDFVKAKIKYLFFDSKFLHGRVKKRFEVTKKIFDEQGLAHMTHVLKGSTPLAQSLELAHYCAWLGYHISIQRQDDPSPEPWITKLKKELSDPTN